MIPYPGICCNPIDALSNILKVTTSCLHLFSHFPLGAQYCHVHLEQEARGIDI